jgi:L-phenylalanine/L-methionine N-acetyltransferase
MPDQEFETFEIVVRAARPEDWEAFYWMREEESVRYNILSVPYGNPQGARDRFTNFPPDAWSLIADAHFPDGSVKMAGQLGFFRGKLDTMHLARFGIQVGTAFQGRGVGSALMASMISLADNWLNLHRIELEVFTDNDAGLALYRKFGFEVEATMVRYAFRDGAYTDAYKMSRLNPRHQNITARG